MILDLLLITYGLDDTESKYASSSVYDTATYTNNIGEYGATVFTPDYSTDSTNEYSTGTVNRYDEDLGEL